MHQLIEHLGLSQKAFAEKVGLPPNGVSQYVTGKRPLTHKAALKIQEAIPSVNIWWLLKWESPMFLTAEPDLIEEVADENAHREAAMTGVTHLSTRAGAVLPPVTTARRLSMVAMIYPVRQLSHRGHKEQRE